MVQYEYRNYQPKIGRWTTRDPLGEAGGMNLYAFVGNNPVNWVDPWGLRVINNSKLTIPVIVNRTPGEPQCILYLNPGEDTNNVLPGWDTDGVYFFHSLDEVYKLYDGVTITVTNPFSRGGLEVTSASSTGTSFAQKHPILATPLRWVEEIRKGKEIEAAGWQGQDFVNQHEWPSPSHQYNCQNIYENCNN